MKRHLTYSSCDHCGELIYEEEVISNQQFDNICTTCHSMIYIECPTCDGCILDPDEDYPLECRSTEHCSCIYCTDKLEKYAYRCIGCHDIVIKPRDDSTFSIVDVCYSCLRTRCLGCFKSARDVVCRE